MGKKSFNAFSVFKMREKRKKTLLRIRIVDEETEKKGLDLSESVSSSEDELAFPSKITDIRKIGVYHRLITQISLEKILNLIYLYF